MKKMMTIAFALAAFAVLAMPTKEDMAEAQSIVNELMKDHVDANKKGKESNVAVGDAAMALAKDAQGEAAKLLLLKGAVTYYARGKEYEKAAGVVEAIMSEIEGVTPTELDGIVKKATTGVPEKKAPRLFAIKKAVASRVRAEAALHDLDTKLKAAPNDVVLRRRRAELLAVKGDWEKALEEFAALGGAVGKKAKEELDGNVADAADFWWDYSPADPTAGDSIKEHAATLYRRALANGELEGLKRNLAEKRAAEFEPVLSANEECDTLAAQMAVKERKEKGLYMVVDLSKIGKKAITYLDGVPKGGWSDEFRTKKIALRKIAPGSFEYMPGKSFKITKPFYIGVFEITQKQYEMVMKDNPSDSKGDMRPVETVSYIDIRGPKKGLDWPKDGAVDNNSYLGKLRQKVGIDFDLPTEVQWEYACRAGTKGGFNVDGVEMVKLGKCRDNGGVSDKHVKVGSFMPNAWGLYDMHGNVWERCLDRGADEPDGRFVFFGWDSEPKETDTDPRGMATGSSRVVRGGGLCQPPSLCRSSARCRVGVGDRGTDVGFRLVCPAETAK